MVTVAPGSSSMRSVAPLGKINQGWPDYEAALKANGKAFTAHFYENANHGFHNDTTPRYDRAAAVLAWSRTIDFFNAHLA